MQLGIFAKTFPGTDPAQVLAAAREAGFQLVQFNLTCAGLPSMPDTIPEAALTAIREAVRTTGVPIAAFSGTYNMAHPDPAHRAQGLDRLGVLIEAAAALGVPLITLCTGTRNRQDMWAHHPDNASPAAWADMAGEIAKALVLAERHGVDLGVEPEPGNVVTSAPDAMRLIAEVGSPRLRIVLDPANLFETGTRDAVRGTVARAVDTAAGHIAMAHAKDRQGDGRVVAAGQGIVDFPDFMMRLRGIGYDGPLVTHGLAAADAPGVAAYLRELV